MHSHEEAWAEEISIELRQRLTEVIIPSSAWVGAWDPVDLKDMLCMSLVEPGPWSKLTLLFLDCSSLVSAFPPLKSFITLTYSRASIVFRLRSQKRLRPKWILFCQESHFWFPSSGEVPRRHLSAYTLVKGHDDLPLCVYRFGLCKLSVIYCACVCLIAQLCPTLRSHGL